MIRPRRCRTARPARPAAVLALALLSAACGGVGPGGGGRDTLYIAVAASRTPTGQAYIDGATMALADLNRRRPANKPPLGLRLPAEGVASQVEIATAFRDDPRVVGVIGHTGSAQTLDAAPIYGDIGNGGRQGLVAIAPSVTNPRVTAGNSWIFRICPTDDDVARALARFARDSLGAHRAAVLYRNDLSGREFERVFRTSFAAAGGVVVERDPYLAGITEFPAYAVRMARRQVDVLVIAGGATDARDIIAAARGAGLTLPVLGTDDLAALSSDPGSAQGTRGLWYAAFFLASERTSRLGRVFTAKFQAAFDHEPDHRAALSYDAASLLGEAAWAANGDRRGIRDWLSGNGGPGPDQPAYQGVSGPIRFTAERNAENKRILIGVIQP